MGLGRCRRTFIFSYVLEGKGEAGVLALDNAHLAKSSFADDSQQPEVVEVHCGRGQQGSHSQAVQRVGMAAGTTASVRAGCSRTSEGADAPWSVNTTGLPLL